MEIGGDTTGLNKALEGVNKQIKNTQSQLKDVEKLLKLDPGNTELLTQRQKLLSDAVSETRQRLETLKTAAEQANTALANGDISQSQYDALQREIIETEERLKNLETQAEQSATSLQKLAASGEQLQKVGDNITSVGKKVSIASVAVTGLGTLAVKTAADFDSAMSQVAAVSGATGEDLEALRDKAREMGAKTKFSASEAAEAMNYMAMAGWKTSDMLNGIEGIMNLAAASGEELATTSDIVTDALSAFGLTAADSAHFADVLAAASSNANTNVSMMGEAFKYVVPVAGALGYSAEDTSLALSLMANAGIKASQGGTALRTAMTNLAKPTDNMAAVMEKYDISLTDASGQMKPLSVLIDELRDKMGGLDEATQAADAAALFGKEAMSGMLAIINAAPADVEKLKSAIEGCDGASFSMAETMQDNLSGQLTILKSQLEELAISFGEMIMPILRSVVTAVQAVVDKLNSMSEGTRAVVLAIGTIIAVSGPLLIFLGSLISSVGKIMTVLPKLSPVITVLKSGIGLIAGMLTKIPTILGAVGTAFRALGVIIAANPVGAIVTAVGLVITALIALWNNCESFRNFFIGVWEGIKTAFLSAIEGIKTGLSQLPALFASIPGAIQTAFSTAVQRIQITFTNLWQGLLNNPIVQTVVNSITTMWTNLKNNLSILWTNIQQIAAGAWELIKNVILAPVLLLIDLVTGDFEGLKNDAIAIWNNIKEAASQIWTGIKDLVANIVTIFATGISQLLEGMKNGAIAIWTALKNSTIAEWEAIRNTVSTLASAMKEAAVNQWTAMKNGINTILSFFTETVPHAFHSMVEAIKEKVSQIRQAVVNGFNHAIAFLQNLPATMKQHGRNIIQGIIDGISEKMKAVVQKVEDTANSIKNKFRSILGIRSPSKVFAEFGRNILEGLNKGVREKIDVVTKAISDTATKLKEKFQSVLGISSPSLVFMALGSFIVSGIAKGISKNTKLAEKATKVLAEKVTKAAQTATSKVTETISDSQLESLKSNLQSAESVLSSLQSSYESAVNAIQSKISSMTDKLRDFELFSTNSRGKTILTDLDKQLAQVEAYGDALENLQNRGISDSLMDEITSMSRSDALNYSKALLKLDDNAFSDYLDTWNKIQSKSASISSSFYQDDLFSVDSEFTSKIQAASAEVARLQSAVESAEAAAEAAAQAAETAASAAQTAVTTTATAATTAATAATTTTSEAATTISAETTAVMTEMDTTVTNGLTLIRQKVMATVKVLLLGVRSNMSAMYASVLAVCNKIGAYMETLYSTSYSWGVDMMQGLIDGIQSQMEALADVAEEAADTISSYLHFSSPDVGPLADYESWMPDFISGLVTGIENSRSMIQKAVNGLASDMIISPKLAMAEGSKEVRNTMTHTGTIRVEGVSEEGQIIDMVDLVIDRLRREVRI